MALAWLGFVKPVVDVAPVALDGPDPLTSAAYATDYNEVRKVGGAIGAPLTERTAAQTATAQFFAGNPVLTYRVALCDLLDGEPLGLLPTTRMFARIDAAMANSFIQTWRLKYDIGYWRPFQAIALADTDGNAATSPQAGWTPLVPNPAYSDYTSGHAAATSPFAEVVRQTLGDDTPLPAEVRWRRAPLQHALRPRVRRPPRPHLGWPALPGRHGRRLSPGAHHGRAGDARDPLTATPIRVCAPDAPGPTLWTGSGGCSCPTWCWTIGSSGPCARSSPRSPSAAVRCRPGSSWRTSRSSFRATQSGPAWP